MDEKIIKGEHKNLGEVYLTEACFYLQDRNPDPTSIFVEFDGEIIEVTKSLVKLEGERSLPTAG